MKVNAVLRPFVNTKIGISIEFIDHNIASDSYLFERSMMPLYNLNGFVIIFEIVSHNEIQTQSSSLGPIGCLTTSNMPSSPESVDRERLTPLGWRESDPQELFLDLTLNICYQHDDKQH